MAKVYFYYSAMNAGKSTTLLQANYNYHERGMQTLLFAPKIDNRFGIATIYSRIGLHQEAVGFDENFSFLAYVKEKKESSTSLKCVLVDEAHFLKKQQVAELTQVATKFNIAVLCYGLRSDFLSEPFEGSKYLLSWAEEVIEIKTICPCGRKATMNMRIDENKKPVTKGLQIQVGGNESYLSLCMKCFDNHTNLLQKYAQEESYERLAFK
jgi:thymidine kinase